MASIRDFFRGRGQIYFSILRKMEIRCFSKENVNKIIKTSLQSLGGGCKMGYSRQPPPPPIDAIG